MPPTLILGTEKTETILNTLPESCLLIDDGPVIKGLPRITRKELSKLPKHPYTRLDFRKDALNPLDGIEHTDAGMLKAEYFLELLNAAFPAGATTLTKQDANDILLHALVENKSRTLSRLIPKPNPKDRGAVDAYRTIQTALLYPVLKRVLDRETTVTLDGKVIVHLDRARMGDRVCFILGNVFISAYPGHVVVPDFPFYAIPSHIQLIRQGRLTAGVDFLSDLDHRLKLRNALLASEQTRPFSYGRVQTYTHHGCRTSYPDAVTLAQYAGLRPEFDHADSAYNAFIEECMGNKS